MNIVAISGILLVVAALLTVLVIAVSKGVYSGKVGAGAAKFLAVIGVLVVLALFVVLMGVLKNLPG